MSAFNVGKKVSAAVRILQRKRDASARATHLVGKKYPLITYEKALLSQATGGKFPSVTFIERKQMSTKTSIKRIALVAAAALTLGGFTAVSANATAVAYAWTTPANGAYAGVGTSAATQVVGGTATLTFKATNNVVATTVSILANVVSTGVGSISTASAAGTNLDAGAYSTASAVAPLGATTGTITWPTTTISAVKGASAGGVVDTQTVTVVLSSSVAGTQTLTATTLDASGTPSATFTATVTWVAAGTSVGVNTANSYVWTVAHAAGGTGANCSFGTSHASDMVIAATNAKSSVPATTALDVCVSARDASGNGVALSTASSVVTSSFGLNTSLAAGAATGNYYGNLAAGPSSTLTGKATWTAVLIDAYGNVATGSYTNTYWGSLASIKLAAYNTSVYAGVDATDLGSYDLAGYAADYKAGVKTGVVSVTGLDSNGNVIDLNTSNATSQNTWTIDSDGTAGAPASRTSDSLGASVVAFAPDAGELKAANYGTNAAYVKCSAGHPEKLTLTTWAKNSLGAWVSSNALDFYCATSTKAITVTPSSTTGDAGSAITVNVMATDAKGYPVADGTTIILAASNGGVAAPSSATTDAGQFDIAPSVILGQGDTTVTAIKGSVSGNATVTVSGGSSSTSSLSLDAANAATDAANNAYDEAQNATQAASDALAAVTALSAQVGALIATVKSLAAVVAKIKAKVKA